jgi:hypothetical protein
MRNLIFKVIGYIFLRFLVFYGTISLIDKNVKGVKWSDLQDKESWFMFLWLFFVPTAIEAILLAFPFSYGLSKVSNTSNKSGYYLLFLGLFIIEFVIGHWLIGMRYPFVKIGVSIVLFLLIFRKRLFITPLS